MFSYQLLFNESEFMRWGREGIIVYECTSRSSNIEALKWNASSLHVLFTFDTGISLQDPRGVNVLKVKDIGVNNHYFIRGYYFQFLFFFTCYHYVIFYFGLKKKWGLHYLQFQITYYSIPNITLKMSGAIFDTLYYS